MDHSTRVAIVDDEAGMRDSLKFLLEREGFQIMTFETGMQAMQVMDRIKFDLFLLDVCLPEMDGFQLLDRIFKIDPDRGPGRQRRLAADRPRTPAVPCLVNHAILPWPQ